MWRCGSGPVTATGAQGAERIGMPDADLADAAVGPNGPEDANGEGDAKALAVLCASPPPHVFYNLRGRSPNPRQAAWRVSSPRCCGYAAFCRGLGRINRCEAPKHGGRHHRAGQPHALNEASTGTTEFAPMAPESVPCLSSRVISSKELRLGNLCQEFAVPRLCVWMRLLTQVGRALCPKRT